jgi:hypothetical protein
VVSVGLHVTDHVLDGGAAPALAFDHPDDSALLAEDEDVVGLRFCDPDSPCLHRGRVEGIELVSALALHLEADPRGARSGCSNAAYVSIPSIDFASSVG